MALLRAGNIGIDGVVASDDLVYVPRSAVRPGQMLCPGDVLIATSSGSLSVVGKSARIDKPMDATFGAFCKVLRPSSDVDPSYFAHFFRTPEYRKAMSRAASGANINNLRGEDLDALEIPLPPIPEQRRIAAILDEADALRTKRRAAQSHLTEITASVFREFDERARRSSMTRPLAEIADIFAGSSLGATEPFHGQADGYLALKVSDMNRVGNERELGVASLWSQAPGARSATAPTGATVLPKRGGAIATNKKRLLSRPAVLDPNLMAVAPKPGLSANYLFAWFEALDLSTLQSGSSVPQLNKQDVAPLEIRVPTLDEQAAFERIQIQVSRAAQIASNQEASIDTLFASLQHRAFTGQL